MVDTIAAGVVRAASYMTTARPVFAFTVTDFIPALRINMARTVCSQLAQYIPFMSTSTLEGIRAEACTDLPGVSGCAAPCVAEPRRTPAAEKPVTIEIKNFLMVF